MNNITTQPRVYVSQRGGRKKIYKDQFVYLGDKEDFNIEIVNPTKNVLAAKVELNGNLLSNNRLVINPGETYVLKRHIDENKAFVFNTYIIDGSDSELVEAISENGKLKISFYKEEQPKQQQCNPCILYWDGYNRYTKGNPDWTLRNYDITCNKTNINSTNFSNCDMGTTTAFYSNDISSFGTNSIGGQSETRSKSFKSKKNDATLDSLNMDSLKDELETGRVGKGESMDQKFEQVYLDFESTVSYTSELQILPDSRKPVDKKKINRIFCHKCGKKSKNGDLFCSTCGTKLIK